VGVVLDGGLEAVEVDVAIFGGDCETGAGEDVGEEGAPPDTVTYSPVFPVESVYFFDFCSHCVATVASALLGVS